eukprot:879856-Prorocentrum_minimum.AAC.1
MRGMNVQNPSYQRCEHPGVGSGSGGGQEGVGRGSGGVSLVKWRRLRGPQHRLQTVNRGSASSTPGTAKRGVRRRSGGGQEGVRRGSGRGQEGA